MDLTAKIEEIEAMVTAARAMPMSASCVVNRAEMLEKLAELRDLLPAQLADAQRVLSDSDAVVDEGRAEAARLIEVAKAERAKLISRTDVVREATAEAERIIATAQADADAMQASVDDYVDTKLANFEIVLQKTLAAVDRGRAKISGRHELSGLGDVDPEEMSLAIEGPES